MFTRAMIDAASQCAPARVSSGRKKGGGKWRPWWNSETSALRQKRIVVGRALHTAIREGDDAEIKRLGREYRQAHNEDQTERQARACFVRGVSEREVA